MEAGTPELPEPESQVGHRKFYLYSTAQRYYLVARSKDRSAWSILKFNRDPELPTCLDVVEDPVTYTERECASLLTQIGAGNKAHGGLTFEVTVCAKLPMPDIAGCRCLSIFLPVLQQPKMLVVSLYEWSDHAGGCCRWVLFSVAGMLPAACHQKAAARQYLR